MAERDHYRWYVSLDELKSDRGITDTSSDAVLKRQIDRASATIDRLTDRLFIPETRTKRFDWHDGYRLVLGVDLLSVTSISDDVSTFAASEYFLYSGYKQSNVPPYTSVELLRSTAFFQYDDTSQRAITIAGQWGYTNEYEDTGGTVQDDPLSDSATSLTVETGTIEVGWSLLIDTEQIWVSAVTTGSPNDTVTIKRAQGGTTAASHVQNTKIYRYLPPADIEQACIEIAGFWFEKRQARSIRSERVPFYTVTYFGDSGGSDDQMALNAAGGALRRRRRLVTHGARST